MSWVGSDTTERSTTSGTAVTLSTVSGLSIAAGTPIYIRCNIRKTTGAANVGFIGLTLNSTIVITPVSAFSATNQAEEGIAEFYVPPRVTGYLRSSQVQLRSATASGATWVINSDTKGGANDLPTVAITSVVITGYSGDALITTAIDEVQVYTMGTGA